MAKTFEYSSCRFTGLNLSSDGMLSSGESPKCVNFSIGDGYVLEKRSGYSVLERGSGEGRGITTFSRGGVEEVVFVRGKSVFAFSDGRAFPLGELESESGGVDFLSFSGKLYILDGVKIKCWDGENFSDIKPYRPLVAISTTPDGAGTFFEEKNLLTGMMRQSFTPDGITARFKLALDTLDSVDYVKVEGVEISKSSYTVNLESGYVTLVDKYKECVTVDGIEIGYTKNTDSAKAIHSMRHAVIYGGENDTRIFLYGDRENPDTIRYSGVFSGEAGMEYFPENAFNKVGCATKISSIVRHFDRLVVFCPNEAFYLYEEKATDDRGVEYSRFPTRPLSSTVGCEAEGFAPIIKGTPVTFDRGTLYRWISTSVRDERYAEDFGERVKAGFSRWSAPSVKCFDSEGTDELFVFSGDEIYVYNYRLDVFYFWRGIRAVGFVTLENSRVLFLHSHGYLCAFSEGVTDDGRGVECEWESDYLDLCRGIKNLHRLDVLVYPELDSEAAVGWVSDKGESGECHLKESYRRFSFEKLDFSRLGFKMGLSPQRFKYRLLHKRFERLKIRISCKTAEASLKIGAFLLSGKVCDKK